MLAGLFTKKQVGDDAERVAEQYLVKHGLSLVERNYRTRFGEIDLIMRDGEALIFVEVRLRKNDDFGGAAASIGTHKQRRLVAAAQQYISALRHPPPCRFDAVLIMGTQIEWLKDAFGI